MGLSEHEQRMLDELERSLRADDVALASKLEKPASLAPKRIIAGVLFAAVGLAALVFGVVAHLIAAGALGFVAMLAGLWLATAKSSVK